MASVARKVQAARPSGRVRRGLATAAVASMVVTMVGGGLAGLTPPPPAAASPGSASAAATPGWQRYVQGPSQPQVYPVRALEPRGQVQRPEALVERNGSMTLTTVAGQEPASVILDFGQEVGGVPFLDVRGMSGSPELQLVTGEAKQFIRQTANTQLTAPADTGDTEVVVGSLNGIEMGGTIVIGSGASAQTFKIAAVDSASQTVTLAQPLAAAAPASTSVTTTTAGAASDESPFLAGVGGPDYRTPSSAGRLEGAFHGGFRYLALTLTTPGSMTIRDLGVDFQAYRATAKDYAGWFESSDDELNRLWYAGAYTLQMNMKLPGINGLPDARIYDAAKRDRSVWTGDLIIQGPTAMSTLGDVGEKYVKGSLDLLLRSQRADGYLPGSPDFVKGVGRPGAPLGEGGPFYYSVNYSGYGARAVIDYYRYSGDDAYAQETLDKVEAAVAYNDRFLDKDKWLIAPRNPDNPEDPNYTDGDRDYFQSYLPGYVTKFSIDYYVLLREMAWYERQVGSGQKAAEYDATADKIKQAVTATLWNQQGGFFGQSNQKMNLIAGDVNGLALRYGFVPKGQETRVLEALKVNWNPYGAIMGDGLVDPTGHTIEPFGIGMETGGRLAVDDTAGAFDLMRRTWGTMIDPANPLYTGTFWEFKNSDGGVNRSDASLAHGWAAAPTVQLTEQVLGIAPIGPGYATWKLQPHPGDLAYAKGAVPTETGTIDVSWTSDKKAGTFALQATSPTGTRGTVAVPADPSDTVTVNGQQVWSSGMTRSMGARFVDGYITFQTAGGTLDVRVQPGAPTSPATKVRSKTTLTIKPASLTYKLDFKAIIKVTAPGVRPTGRVNLVANGRRIGTGTLTKGKARIVITVRKNLKPGKYRFVAEYRGSAQVIPSSDRHVERIRPAR
jgi:hypothetical protein